MPYTIVRNDLLKVEVDAIVLPSNSELLIDGGVGALLASQSDWQKLQTAVLEFAPCPVGSAVTTPSFAQNARHYIHAVGPVWQGGSSGEEAQLKNTYRAIFAEAMKNQCTSVAMPLISAGTFGYPVEQAFDIAVQEIRTFIDQHDDIDVTLVVYDSEAFAAAAKRFEGIRSYIEHSYVSKENAPRIGAPASFADYSVAPSNTQIRRAAALREESEESSQPASQSKSVGIPKSAPRARSAAPSAPKSESVATPQSAPQPSFSATPQPGAEAAPKKQRSVLPPLPVFEGAFSKQKRPKESSYDASSLKVPERSSETWTCICGSENDGNFCPLCGSSKEKAVFPNLESWISSLDEGFSVTLCKLIDKKNLTDPEVYKRANISRQLFSKIRSNPNYQPKKPTAVALCIALELSLAETQDLLRRAGLALSNANLFDVIVQYHIEQGIYDYFIINDALFSFDCPLLGGK